MSETEFAPAKVNLFLHVGRPGSDGRHPVASLATFANVGDMLVVRRAARFTLTVDGPFANDIGPADDNLISRALAIAEAPPMAVHLTKALPAASGLGGGSSDAGAALRAALKLFPEIGEDRIAAAAGAIGADGPLCLRASAALAEGQGERLSDPPGFPALACVLVNPGVASPTGPVYRAYDADPHDGGVRLPQTPSTFADACAFIEFLASCRNDLEGPAVRLEPRIGQCLDWLRRRTEPVLVRMSGSGATCFALCEDDAAAGRLAAATISEHPAWWVKACRLDGAGQPG